MEDLLDWDGMECAGFWLLVFVATISGVVGSLQVCDRYAWLALDPDLVGTLSSDWWPVAAFFAIFGVGFLFSGSVKPELGPRVSN